MPEISARKNNLTKFTKNGIFGAPPGTAVNHRFTFQEESLSVCQNGSWGVSTLPA